MMINKKKMKNGLLYLNTKFKGQFLAKKIVDIINKWNFQIEKHLNFLIKNYFLFVSGKWIKNCKVGSWSRTNFLEMIYKELLPRNFFYDFHAKS